MNKINISHIVNIISISVFIESIFIATSIPVALFYKESVTVPLIFSFLVAFVSGVSGFLLTRKNSSEHSIRDTYASVFLTWIFISVYGAFPFIFTDSIPKFHDAFFEAASGFSTTGATILKEVENLPKSVLLWRSETHLLGGMGIIVLIIVFLPLSKAGGQHMMMAEGSFVNSEKIKSRSIDVAKRMWLIYISLTVIEIILLTIAGMDLFDSICHSFGTIATGGFSTKNDSIMGYSPLIQYILILFMISGGINFSLYYLLIHGKLKKVISNEELKLFLLIIFFSTLIIVFILKVNFNYNWEKSIRDSLFQVVSIISTTGYITS
ncbi:MAG: TrkH family potassium uptake protein, partial [Prolixibacteraceae bacterium]|nr:TrkH family potassium uptake protein [Prolixibacteraceae bacterium]